LALLRLGFTNVDEPIVPMDENLIEQNPAKDLIKVTLPENEHTRRIAIKNLFGEDVSAFDLQNTNARQLSIDISGLPSGIYFVQVGSKILKFVKL
jgi:hypothetical protein